MKFPIPNVAFSCFERAPLAKLSFRSLKTCTCPWWKWKLLSHVQLFATPWNSPGQNTGVGSLSLLQGIFPTQGSNPGLPHCGQILYQLSHKGSPLSLVLSCYSLPPTFVGLLLFFPALFLGIQSGIKGLKGREVLGVGVRDAPNPWVSPDF